MILDALGVLRMFDILMNMRIFVSNFYFMPVRGRVSMKIHKKQQLNTFFVPLYPFQGTVQSALVAENRLQGCYESSLKFRPPSCKSAIS
jgi:hypothetical protein